MALNYVTVTGTFEDGSGAPLSGNVTFTPSQSVYAAGIPLVTPGTPITAEIAGGQLLNGSGAALTLLATDNAGLSLESGTGFWFWNVSLQFGQVTDGWSFFLPHTPSPADLYSTKNTGTSGGAAVTSVFGRMGAVVAVSGDYTAAQVGALPIAGGTMTGWLAPAAVALTFGSSIAVNAALGNAFNLTLTASTGTLANPSNPVDGQVIRFRVTQGTGGSFTLAYGSAYDFGATGTPTLSTAAGKVDVLGFEYVASIGKWCYLGSGLDF